MFVNTAMKDGGAERVDGLGQWPEVRDNDSTVKQELNSLVTELIIKYLALKTQRQCLCL